MNIGEDQVGVVFEAVKYAVAMVRIDIDIGDLLDTVLLSQILDRDAAVVEYAKAGGDVPSRMVQAAIGENARLNSPRIIRSTASVTEPATWLAASNMPTKDGVSPPSR